MKRIGFAVIALGMLSSTAWAATGFGGGPGGYDPHANASGHGAGWRMSGNLGNSGTATYLNNQGPTTVVNPGGSVDEVRTGKKQVAPGDVYAPNQKGTKTKPVQPQ
jgi:hypothetical protein